MTLTAKRAKNPSRAFRPENWIILNWSLQRSRVNGEKRLEVLGFDPRALSSWKAKGCFTEIIAYQTRLFMPVSNAREIVAKLAA